MSSYSYLRRTYKKLIQLNECYCILSGLKIPTIKDLSMEHYFPQSKGEYEFTHQIKNVFPAIKIINSIKQDKLPCEWEDQKFNLLYRAVHHYNLNDHDYNIVVAAIKNIENYKVDPCLFCINNIKCKTR